jgi:DNA polymerase-3 subunit beta
VISADKTPLVRINLSSGKLVVSARDPDRGNAVVEIDVDYDGEPLEVSYNNRYLLDALTSLTGREVLVSVRDQDAASILSNPEDGGLLQLIMPVRP